MARSEIELKTNLPLRGTLKYVNWRETQHGGKPKVVLVVANGQEHYSPGEGELWLFGGAERRLAELGAVKETTAPDATKRDFRVQGKPDLRILRTEEKGDDNKLHKVTTIERLDAYAPPAAAVASAPTPTDAAPPAEPEDATARRRRHFTALLETAELYGSALKLAHYEAQRAGVPMSPESLQAGAATILIRAADRVGVQPWRGLFAALEEHLAKTSAPMAPTPSPAPPARPSAAPARPLATASAARSGSPGSPERFDDFPAPRGEDEDDDLPF